MTQLSSTHQRASPTVLHHFLVFAQLCLAAAIVLTARWWPIDPVTLILSAPGAAIAIGAWIAIGPSQLRMHPSPTQRTRLVTHGPYRWVRHPMYTGLLLFTAALLLSGFAWWRLAAWLTLLAVLVVKANEEERMLLERFSQYAQYRDRSAKLFPLVY